MTNTIPNVPRELLEELRDAANESMNATTRQHQIDHFAGLIAKADALLSAPSPAGVDGLEVVLGEDAAFGCKYVRLSDAKAIIDGLRAVIDKAWNRGHQLDQKAYIPGALDAWKRPVLQHLPYDFSGNPGASATQYCNGWNDAGGYWKAHADDLVVELDQQAQRIGELEGLLRHAQKQVPTGSGLHMRIDAALSAVCAAAPNIATTSEHNADLRT